MRRVARARAAARRAGGGRGRRPPRALPMEKKNHLPQVLDPVILKDDSPRFEPFDVLGRGQELGDEAAELGAGRGV